MSACLPAFCPIGVVTIQVVAGAGNWIVNLILWNSGAGAVLADIRGKIDLVGRGTNAGTKLNDDVRGLTAIAFPHFRNGTGSDAKFGALLAGMDQSAGALNRVDQIDSAAIGHIDTEEFTGCGGDQSIRIRPGLRIEGAITFGDLAAVNLLAEPGLVVRDSQTLLKGFGKVLLQTRQRGIPIRPDIDIGMPQHKAVDETRNGIEGRKSLEQGEGHERREEGREFSISHSPCRCAGQGGSRSGGEHKKNTVGMEADGVLSLSP